MGAWCYQEELVLWNTRLIGASTRFLIRCETVCSKIVSAVRIGLCNQKLFFPNQFASTLSTSELTVLRPATSSRSLP
jgi:hypothetical protein